MKPEIDHGINELIRLWNYKNAEYTKQHFQSLTADTLVRKDGNKFVKLTRGNSVFAFVDQSTGDILKPACWARPAKGVRGSVLAGDYGMSCLGPYGVIYLRGPNIGW